jgi:hypothetical protein
MTLREKLEKALHDEINIQVRPEQFSEADWADTAMGKYWLELDVEVRDRRVRRVVKAAFKPVLDAELAIPFTEYRWKKFLITIDSTSNPTNALDNVEGFIA